MQFFQSKISLPIVEALLMWFISPGVIFLEKTNKPACGIFDGE